MARDLNVDQIKKLWILDLVLQQGSLKKAALAAKVSPSAISQSLSSLEGAFGRPLLIREKGSVLPTQDALNILDVVRPAFDAFDRLKDLSGEDAPKISWINFGTYESIAIDLLPGLIHSLRQKLPQTRLGVRISRTGSLLTMVRKGELCSALITEVEDLDRFYVKEVARDRLGLYVSRHSEFVANPELALKTLGIGSLATGRNGLPIYFSKFMRSHQITRPDFLSDSFETLRAACAAGTIVSVLPSRVANRQDDLVELPDERLNKKATGEHGILIVSQLNCDREETDFMAKEASRFLNKN